MLLIFGSINADLIVPVARLPHPGETVLAGAVGPDPFARVALSLLQRDGVDTSLVRKVEQPTGCAAIMVSSTGENMIAVAPGANASVRSDQVPDKLLDPK